ncbi:MAG: HlyD family efflux transporter periplasmic adaptor subunit [Pseudomonadota bacterium]
MNKTSFASAAFAALLLAGCAGDDSPDATIGYVEADWRYVSAPAAGWIVDLPVAEGDRIDVGDLLFELDATSERAQRDEAEARVRQAEAEALNIETGARAEEIEALRARLAEAQAQLTRATADHDRVMPLVEAGLEPRSRGDALTADLAVATASVKALQADIRVAVLAARPNARQAAAAATESARAARDRAAYSLAQRKTESRHAGRIETLLQERGEYVTPGTPVLAVLPDDGLKVRFFVPQAALPGVSLGATVRVSADGMPSVETASVTYIATEAEFTPPVIYSRESREKLVFLVEARLPNGSALRPGLPVDVSW